MHDASCARRTLVVFTALIALAAVGAAPAAAAGELLATTVSTEDDATWRRCHDRLLEDRRAVAQRRVQLPTAGLVWATLDAPGDADWDLAVFEADSGRLVAASAGPDTQELAEGFALGERELVVQACLVDGESGAPRLDVGVVQTNGDADGGPIQLVRVSTPTEEDKTRLTQLGLDLTEHGGPGFVDAVLYDEEDEAALRRAGFEWTVEVPDLVARSAASRRADARFEASMAASDFPSGRTSYRRLADYEADMKELALQNPALVKLIELPHESLEGRKVLGIEITTNVNVPDGKPVYLQMGLHHAREWPSGEHAIEWAYELVNGYNGGDARARDLVERVRTIVVPVQNPDGFNLSREAPVDLRALSDLHPLGTIVAILADPGFAYKRRNCRVEDFERPAPGECGQRTNRDLGVDPNRNYGGLWGGPGASTDPTSDTYRGALPFSEPENQNIRELVSTRQVTTLITNHTFSNLILRPPGVREQGPPPDEDIYRALGADMAAQNGYVNQRGYELYDTTGTTEDWTYPATGGLGFTFEIGPDEFHPPYEEAAAEWRGTRGFEGKGNREAYYIAMENAADTATHAVIEGTAEPGSVLRLHKEFLTSTHDPIFEDDDGTTTRPVEQFTDTLDTTMVVPESGGFELHANPSTRPAVASRSYPTLREEPSRTETFSNSVPTVPGAGAQDQPVYYQEFTFEVSEGDDRAGLGVSIDGGDLDDYDLYLYRQLPDGARVLMGSSLTATADEEVIIENVEPGTYVARVLNWLAVTPFYDGEWATYAEGGTVYEEGTTEAWTFTCERPGGEVVNTEKVIVDRGERVRFDGLCAP